VLLNAHVLYQDIQTAREEPMKWEVGDLKMSWGKNSQNL
jgi:hypothetical protein